MTDSSNPYNEIELEQKIRQKAISLLKEVFRSLPEYDRAKVSHYDPKVVVTTEEIPSAACAIHLELVGGETATVIKFGPEFIKQSDTVCKYLIAHEFAHIVLEHLSWKLFADHFYYEDQVELVRELHEEHADYMVINNWGFMQEAIAAADALGSSTLFLSMIKTAYSIDEEE